MKHGITQDPTLPCSKCGTQTYTGGWCPKCGLYKPSRPPRRSLPGETELGGTPIAQRLLDGANLALLAGDDSGPLCDYCGERRSQCHCQEGVL